MSMKEIKLIQMSMKEIHKIDDDDSHATKSTWDSEWSIKYINEETCEKNGINIIDK